MGSPTGFREFERRDHTYLPVSQRIQNFREFTIPLDDIAVANQGARCIDCGVPYCHTGCPVDNLIPDWNDLVHRGDWRRAAEVLHSTNNFPEFTGRICPAPCEEACTLNLHDAPVTIKTIESSIIEKAWAHGWIEPQIPRRHSNKSVAVIGSGPAGLACAQQLARAGHQTVVYEKNAKIGGLLRYGIPDFKLAKSVIDRRMAQMQAEGVEFRVNSNVGTDIPISEIIERYDAVVLTGGCEHPRDLEAPGRDLDGVHFAMDYLTQQNRRNGNEPPNGQRPIIANDKHVIVIGGGDTGSDCVGTANRQGAASITQLELLSQPEEHPDKLATWPEWPNRLRTSSSHEEGCDRRWAVQTQRLTGTAGKIDALHAIRVDWQQDNGNWVMAPVPGSEFTLRADLVLIATGFTGPAPTGLLETLDVELDRHGNVRTDTETYRTSIEGVFAAGDMRRGQSLVVWAIFEGRQCARAVENHLAKIGSLSH